MYERCNTEFRAAGIFFIIFDGKCQQYFPSGKVLEEFDVEEKSGTELERRCPNVRVIQGKAVALDPVKKVVILSNQRRIPYDKCCVCTGATPKLIVDNADFNEATPHAIVDATASDEQITSTDTTSANSYVIGIRDVESVVAFQRKLASARRICVVGNGGISLELGAFL